MRKELFFAIGAGLILGLIIAFGIWRVNKTIIPTNDSQNSISDSSPTPTSNFSITIANAENLDVITESPFLISGLTKPNIKIAISTEEKDYIVDSQKDGSFEKEISLSAGLNEIFFKAFDQNGEFVEKKLKLVYSSEFEKYLDNESEEKIATDEADSVRIKVEEKIANAMKNPKAYIGTITDISSSTYQIKNIDGDIEQISFTKDTDFIKVDKTSKTITSDDVAIGDSIIAMGFKNGNDVLAAERVLVTEITSDLIKEIYMAKISDTTTKEITVLNLGSQEELVFLVNSDTDYVLLKDAKLSVIKLSSLEKDQIIYLFVIKSEKSSLVRTLYLIENTETPSPTPTSSASPSPKSTLVPKEE